jgi:hypothetical protein
LGCWSAFFVPGRDPGRDGVAVVIAGLDPVIPSDSGGCGGAQIKSGHDDEEMD